MSPIQCYRYYLALRLHFSTDKFDVWVDSRVKCSDAVFEKRNDRVLFDKLSAEYSTDSTLIQYMVANFAYGHVNFVYDEAEAKECFFEWQRRKESRTKIISDDIETILAYASKNNLNRDEILNFDFGTLPAILYLLLGGFITVESVCVLSSYLSIDMEWKNADFVSMWNGEIRRIHKLKKFVQYKKEKIDPLMEHFLSEIA